MHRRRLLWVDAFTRKPMMGNACVVIFDAQDMSDPHMQSIACEMRQSETVFVTVDGQNELHLRIFTTEKEIPLAGHPTLSAVHAALELGLLNRPADSRQDTHRVHLVEGPINVELDSDGLMRMSQRKPQFLTVLEPGPVAACFGLESEDLIESVPCQIVSTGTR